jgi:cell shape-determining protein MreD
MAKKYEFKPDKPNAGLLSKLYLTQKQRKSLLKWTIYGLLLVFLSVLQDVLLCRISIFGATTELVPCGIFLICVLEGVDSGTLFALVAGALYVFSGSSAGNHVIVLIPVVGFLVTWLRQSYLRSGFGAAMLCTVAAMVLYVLAVFLISVFFGVTPVSRIGIFGLQTVLTLLAAPALYPLVRLIGKVGGEAWKE